MPLKEPDADPQHRMTDTLRCGLTVVEVGDRGVVRVAWIEVGHQGGYVLSSCEHPMDHVAHEDEA